MAEAGAWGSPGELSHDDLECVRIVPGHYGYHKV